jgi:hypothetical protein
VEEEAGEGRVYAAMNVSPLQTDLVHIQTHLSRWAPHYSFSHKISFVCSPRVHFALLQPSFGSSPRVADSLYERPRALRSHKGDLVYAPEQLRRARHNEAPTRYVSFEKIRRNGANPLQDWQRPPSIYMEG